MGLHCLLGVFFIVECAALLNLNQTAVPKQNLSWYQRILFQMRALLVRTEGNYPHYSNDANAPQQPFHIFMGFFVSELSCL